MWLHWLVKKIPSVQTKNDNQFVMDISIETMVNVAKRALDLKTSLWCVVRAGKFELILTSISNTITSLRLGLKTLKLIIHKTTVTLQK